MNRIAEICEKKHITYSELARQAGISAMYVGLLAKGKRTNPSREVMGKIAAALGESVITIFFPEE